MAEQDITFSVTNWNIGGTGTPTRTTSYEGLIAIDDGKLGTNAFLYDAGSGTNMRIAPKADIPPGATPPNSFDRIETGQWEFRFGVTSVSYPYFILTLLRSAWDNPYNSASPNSARLYINPPNVIIYDTAGITKLSVTPTIIVDTWHKLLVQLSKSEDASFLTITITKYNGGDPLLPASWSALYNSAPVQISNGTHTDLYWHLYTINYSNQAVGIDLIRCKKIT